MCSYAHVCVYACTRERVCARTHMSVCTHALSDMYVLVLVHICAVSARAHLGIGTQDVTARDTPEMVSVVTGNKGGG